MSECDQAGCENCETVEGVPVRCVNEQIALAAQLLRECRGVMEREGFWGEVKRIDAWLADNGTGDL